MSAREGSAFLPRTRDGYLVLILGIFLAGSMLLNGALGWRLQHAQPETGGGDAEATGMLMSALSVQDLTGSPATIPIGKSKKPIVLYILSPTCIWCARNLNNIRLLSRARAAEFDFFGISVNEPDLPNFVESLGLPFPVYAISAYKQIRELNLGNTPQTLVISREGKVLKNWLGAYTGKPGMEIEAYFSVSLPGLSGLDSKTPEHPRLDPPK